VTPQLHRRLRKESCKFKVSLACIEISTFQKRRGRQDKKAFKCQTYDEV
jgi:hypothetical protein